MVIFGITLDNNTLEEKVYFSVRHNISYYVAKQSEKGKIIVFHDSYVSTLFFCTEIIVVEEMQILMRHSDHFL
jgi:hypothetical protein